MDTADNANPSVLVIGGTGFIGSHVVAKLVAAGCNVTVPTRRARHGQHLKLLPTANIVEANVHDDATLNMLVLRKDAVVNLVGILHDKPVSGAPYGRGFARAHVELPQRIVAACAAHRVRRAIHISALGADRGAPSMYLRSKADGEAAMFANPAVGSTVLRPSVVFGEEDNFLNTFAWLQAFLPVMLLGGADARFQPIYVQDVAWAVVNALGNDHTIGKIYELAGPKVYTLRQLVQLAGVWSGHRRPVIGLPDSLARLQAGVLEHLPGEPLMSRDNLESMKVANVASGPISPDLLITPTPLEAVAPAYLAR
ncbi:NADH dehydrogenase [Noviherbaspirillum humi]|uniref:NADH dehydrogenase n=1 Tax=Noviherbaspirillum humi TaxID=1688639 RepID=A0A239CHY0_9BURK|nr:complex I NDUFA9 subunit family protein [Noviherbaspirillum humi]SNS18953.1 NADH dehydrogenase [Noviherbaspirillum humi]